MPLGLTQSGYYSGMEKSFDERLKDNKIRQMAAAQGKSVKVFNEDRQYLQDIADINAENEANEAEEGKWTPGVEGKQPESEAARNARLEGERQANVLKGGVVPERRDTGSYRALDVARASVDSETLGDLAEDEASARTAGIDSLSSSGPDAFKQRYADSETLSDLAEDEASALRAGISNVGPSGPNAYNLRARMDSEALSDLAEDEASARTSRIDRIDPSGPGMPSKKYTQNLGPEGTLDSEALSDLEEDEASERRGLMPIEDAEAQIDEMVAAGEQSDAQQDENDPVVKEAKELQKKAAEGDPEAQKAQEEMYDGLPKEEKAMAKEEFGNYYIGPGGFAVNLDKVESDNKRAANFMLLQHLPDHAKTYMLGQWGYIDKEDLKNMPESPEYHLEEMKLMKGLEKLTIEETGKTKRKGMGVEGTKDVATIQTEAQKLMSKDRYAQATDVQKMRSHTTETVTKMGIDYNLLKDSDIMTMDLNDNELKLKIANLQDVTANKKIDEITKNFNTQIASNEDITKWGFTSDKFINTSNANLARELKDKDVTGELGLKNLDVGIIEKQIAGVRENMISKLASAKELSEMGISAQELIAGRADATERYKVTTRKSIDLKKIRQAGDHFTKEIAFKYKELGANTLFKNVQLAQLSATEIMKHNRLTEEQKQTWFVRQHTANQQVADTLFSNGQIEAAMMIMAKNGVSKPPNLTNFWKMRGQKLKGTVAVQEAVTAMGTTFEKANTGYLKALNKMHTDLTNPKQVQEEYTALDLAVMETGGKPWQEMNDEERANQKDTMGNPITTYLHWKAAKTQETIDRRFNSQNAMYGKYHQAMKSDEMRIRLDINNKDKQKKNGKTGPPVETKETVKKKESITPEGPKTTYGSQMQDILKDVYAGRKKQIGMKLGRTPKFTPDTLENNEKMRKASLADGKKDLETAVGTKIKGKLRYGGTPGKALDHFSQYPQDLKRLKNLDLKHYIMNELNKREVKGKIGF